MVLELRLIGPTSVVVSIVWAHHYVFYSKALDNKAIINNIPLVFGPNCSWISNYLDLKRFYFSYLKSVLLDAKED